MKRALLLLSVAALAVPAVYAQGITGVEVAGNTLSARIALPGNLSADLTLEFEDVVGLSAANLGLSAETVNPMALLARLPAGGLVTMPGAFPVVLRVEPPASSPLSFSGVYKLSLHTHNLNFTAGCPLRLYTASQGGAFRDITETMGMGSYRVRGGGGTFSEFAIVADARAVDTVIGAKFAAIDALLSNQGNLISDPAVLTELQQELAAARSAHAAGQTAVAAQRVDDFAATVRDNSGSAIPDVWRPTGDLQNLAGRLRAAAASLRFSLNLKASPV